MDSRKSPASGKLNNKSRYLCRSGGRETSIDPVFGCYLKDGWEEVLGGGESGDNEKLL